MLTALRDTGWRNYSLFLRPGRPADRVRRGPTTSRAAQAAMAATAVDARWQAGDGRVLRRLGRGRPDEGFLLLEEVFRLEDQLAALAPVIPERSENGAPSYEREGLSFPAIPLTNIFAPVSFLTPR